ncbi:MAG: hypothetical protein P8183_22595 [Anaerolineae bacterium]
MTTFRDKLNGNTLYTMSQIVRSTCRYQVSGLEHLKTAQADDQPLVLATWHGMTMMLVGFFASHYNLENIVLLMPDDWRGEALQVFANKLGTEPFPMDLEGEANMATARQLATLVRRVKQGRDCYITPDGPDGPAYEIKPGVAFIAQKAKAPILPLGAPYPFSRVSVAIGEPLWVGKDEELTAVTQTLTDRLHRITAQATANYYEQRSKAAE